MNLSWDRKAGEELLSISKQDRASGIAVGQIYRAFEEFAQKGVPAYAVACPLVNAVNICYWPSTDIKGFFGYDDVILRVVHFSVTTNSHALDRALDISSDRYLSFLGK